MFEVSILNYLLCHFKITDMGFPNMRDTGAILQYIFIEFPHFMDGMVCQRSI